MSVIRSRFRPAQLVRSDMTRKVSGPEIERVVQLLGRLPGLGPRSARKAALALIKRRNDLLVPLAEALAERGRQDRRVPQLRQPRHGVAVQPLPGSAPRSQHDRRRRGDRRSLGAGARRRRQWPLPRAWRPPVAARRHRARPPQHRAPHRARRKLAKCRRSCSPSTPRSRVSRRRITSPSIWRRRASSSRVSPRACPWAASSTIWTKGRWRRP